MDTVYWFDAQLETPTVRRIVEHVRLIMDVDLSFPIILGADGRVMDGMHRIARALLDAKPFTTPEGPPSVTAAAGRAEAEESVTGVSMPGRPARLASTSSVVVLLRHIGRRCRP